MRPLQKAQVLTQRRKAAKILKKTFDFLLAFKSYVFSVESLTWFACTQLRTLDNPLRPQTTAADREGSVPQAVLLIGFREVAAAAKGTGRKHKIVQTLAISDILRVQPNLLQ
jgi:hypothetical protein